MSSEDDDAAVYDDDADAAAYDDDAALDDDDASLEAALDRAYEEAKSCIDEGVAVLRDVTGSNGDTIMGDETSHMKRAPDRTVEELNDDEDEFGTMTSDYQ
jgi:hypothetical protein